MWGRVRVKNPEEHRTLNRVLKDDLNTLRANITEHSIQRSSWSLGPLQRVLDNCDKVVGLHKPSGKHANPEPSEDMKMILQLLKREGTFEFTLINSMLPSPICQTTPC